MPAEEINNLVALKIGLEEAIILLLILILILICLSIAIGLTPGGSSTVHIYTQQYTE